MKRSQKALWGTAIMVAAAGCSDDDTTTTPQLPEDPLQQVVYSEVRPPPISGGTLLVTHDARWAVAADPDRDRVLVVDAAGDLAVREIALQAGDEPGRVIEDASGRVHVALRNAGAVVTIDPTSANVLSRREVCAAPRGMAVSEFAGDVPTLLVACAGGDLVELGQDPAGAILSRIELDTDLRDIVVTGQTRAERRLLVSRFRAAEVLRVGPDNTIEKVDGPTGYVSSLTSRAFSPTVAWRMVPDGEQGALMMHQRSTTVTLDESVPPGASYYGGFDCNTGVVLAAATHFDSNGARTTPEQRGGIGGGLLPVDVAVSGREYAYVAAGSDTVGVGAVDEVDQMEGCDGAAFSGFGFGFNQITLGPEPIAVAYRNLEAENPSSSTKELFVQLREPSMLVILDADLTYRDQVDLGGARRFDTGHKLFHANPDGTAIASCASCHPEGRDDGHTWMFKAGARRTQSLSGGILETAPFHWQGELSDMSALMEKVFQERMGNIHQSEERVFSLATWLDSVPRIPARTYDADAVARGKAVFERADTACTTCHSGATFTNNQNSDVGTGEALQVPGLRGVRDRAPYMHDGCAPTLRDRFDANGPCGGNAHGDVSALTDAEIDDLVTYMSSL